MIVEIDRGKISQKTVLGILATFFCVVLLLAEKQNGKFNFRKFRYMKFFLRHNGALLLTLLAVVCFLYSFCRDISVSLIAAMITYVLFQGAEYVAKLDKWYKLRGGVCATLMFYQMTMVHALRYEKFPIKVIGFADEHQRIDSTVANRTLHETGNEVEEIKKEIEYVKNYTDLIVAMLHPQTVMEYNKEKMNKFEVELQNIVPSIRTALGVVANVNPDKDRLIFTLNRLLENNRMLLYSVKKQDSISPREFLSYLKETLEADCECLKSMIIEFIQYKDGCGKK